jgi:tetratricopeptide (TPR) repeat protein
VKYFYVFLIFIFGVALGRWSVPSAEKELATSEVIATSDIPPVETEKSTKSVEGNISPEKTLPPNNPSSLARTENNLRDKKMRELYDQLTEAGQKEDVAEQNALLAEMEKLDSKHEKVFQAKAEFLQDDADWEGAHKVLEECVAAIPSSVYCLRRLTNIRSSTNDDKIRYGYECLQAAKNEQLCMVDLAIALHSKGQFAKAKEYFEQALNLPMGTEGYNKEYILFQYGNTLESLSMNQKAREVFAESCRLGNGSACIKVKTGA